jgi:hypothetical protein
MQRNDKIMENSKLEFLLNLVLSEYLSTVLGLFFFQNMQFRYPVVFVSLIWLYFFYSEIRPYSSKISLIKIIPLFKNP